MSRIVAVVGAGRVGVTVATLLSQYTKYIVTIIDADQGALDVASANRALSGCSFSLAVTDAQLEAVLRETEPFATVCCTPFQMNVKIAAICDKIRSHYVDFTEDVSVTRGIVELNPSQATFVLQTGLAPGLITSIGKVLLERLAARGLTPTSLKMRVGALPEVAELPAAYALTWSSEGLINEYYQPVQRIANGQNEICWPLDDLEELIIDGTRMEAFNTSGGMGDPSMYKGLVTVDYKTMRYPGHLDFLQKWLVAPLQDLTGNKLIEAGVKIAEALFPRTRDDVVYLVARAQGLSATGVIHETVFQHKFYAVDGITALELTTAGTGAAVVELLDTLPPGIVFGGNVALADLCNTNVGKVFLESMINEYYSRSEFAHSQ
jgi:saccharopine dehydrogenase-like NADP-dependent oxidoreductase